MDTRFHEVTLARKVYGTIVRTNARPQPSTHGHLLARTHARLRAPHLHARKVERKLV